MIKAVSKKKFIRELVRKYLAVRKQRKTPGLNAYGGYPSISVFEEGYEIGAQHLVISCRPNGSDYLILDQHFGRSQRGTENLLRVAAEIERAATRKISAKTREPAYIGLPSPRRFAPWYFRKSEDAD